ncbi:MAG: hypothetical protein ACLGSD_05480 [Acidobacteriota bacterium]
MAVPVIPTLPERIEEAVVVAPLPFGFTSIPETGHIVGTGWIPDRPDLRDYTADHPAITKMIDPVTQKALKGPLPAVIDLRPFCSPVENQGMLGSCTANAAVGVVEYYENRAYGKYIDGARLFVYKTTRSLLAGWATPAPPSVPPWRRSPCSEFRPNRTGPIRTRLNRAPTKTATSIPNRHRSCMKWPTTSSP